MSADASDCVILERCPLGLRAIFEDADAIVLSPKAVLNSTVLASILHAQSSEARVSINLLPARFRAWHDFAAGVSAPAGSQRLAWVILVRTSTTLHQSW